MSWVPTRDRQDQKFWYNIDTDTFAGSKSIPRLILGIGLNRDWYRYQENVLGLILISSFYFIRILSKHYYNAQASGTDTETQNTTQLRPILIPNCLVSAFSIPYWYSRLSLDYLHTQGNLTLGRRRCPEPLSNVTGHRKSILFFTFFKSFLLPANLVINEYEMRKTKDVMDPEVLNLAHMSSKTVKLCWRVYVLKMFDCISVA